MDKQVAARIARRFIALPLDKRTRYLQTMLAEGISPAQLPIPALSDELEALPLSYAQERQWFLWQLEPHSDAYHIPLTLRLRGNLDLVALQHSFTALLGRHGVLRTCLKHSAETPVQEVLEQVQMQLEVCTDEALDAFVQRLTRQPFDLAQAPLLRAGVARQGEDDHVLVVVMHHIISDGWSIKVMLGDLIEFYRAALERREPRLPALPVQYSDYAVWQRRWMEAGERERQLQYWTAQLAGDPDALELPLDFARPPQQSYRGARLSLSLDTDLARALDAVSRQQGVTLFMLLLAAYQVLLHRYTGQDDIRVGVPVANRNRVETEGLIGFFTNTQVLRGQVDSRARFCDFLQQVRETVVQGQNHQDLPFEQLVEALRPERSLSHNALFQVMYNHQRVGKGDARHSLVADLTLETLPVEIHAAQFDLTLDTFESEAGLSAALTYATDLFEPATIERFGQSWLTLLRGIVADPQQAITDLPVLDAQVRQAQLDSWQGEVCNYSPDETIHGAVEAQVVRDPQRLALVHGHERLTYGQLNARANRLARYLVSLGVGPEVRVGVALVRSPELVVTLLAILKAGGAYVPLDPDYPAERIAYMLENSQAPVLVSQAGVIERLSVPAHTHVLLVQAGEQWLSDLDESDLADSARGDNLGYVIYTSGSTGRPKGVAICHRNVAALRHWTARVYAPHDLQGVLASTSVCFDLSVWELFVTLGLGGFIVLARNALELAELPARDEVRLINTVPSAIAALLREGSIGPGVRIINLAGEPLKQPLVDALYQGTQVSCVYDLYGPSEDTTYSTWTRRDAGGRANIGRPLDDTRGYALDLQLNVVPVGVGAELYLAGSGITRGYLSNPGLTAERFVPDPLRGNGERMYRTADRVRFDDNGVIQYLGRLDHQVKVRGFRIETGEIEARLLAHEQVREAAVLVLDGAHGAFLVAYVVGQGIAPSRDVLRQALAVDLPDYMIPAQWVFIDALPLTPNGKLDRKRLPAPDPTELASERQAPGNDWERRLLDVWRAVLKLDELGVTDNFFEVGGDSIVSIQMVSRARQAGIRFTPKELFQHQTVRSLALVATAAGLTDIDQGEVQGGAPLMPFQRWFFEAPIIERQHWNQSVLLRPTASLDAAAVEQALQALIVHHDVLRQSFHPTAGVQALHRSVQQQRLIWQQVPALEHRCLGSQEQLLDVCEQAQRSLDLEGGPLVRAVLIDLPDASQRLLLVIHHLVVDGVSWRILFEDLQQAYCNAVQQQAVRLPAKTSPVQAWAQRLQGYAAGAALEQKAYWMAQADGVEVDLPRDWPVQQALNNGGRSVETRLGKDLTRRLLQQAPGEVLAQARLDTAPPIVECLLHGPVARQIDLDAVRLRHPVGLLFQGGACGIALQALRPGLHRAGLGRQPYRLLLHRIAIGLLQVLEQNAPRDTIDHKVVDHQQQPLGRIRQVDQYGANQRSAFQVEAALGLLTHVEQLLLAAKAAMLECRYLLPDQPLLLDTAVQRLHTGGWVERLTQHIMVHDERLQSLLHGSCIKGGGRPQQHRLVPVLALDDRRLEEPALKWHQRRAALHFALVYIGQPGRRGDQRQAAHSLVLEQLLGGEPDARLARSADHLDRNDRVTTDFEEVVRHAQLVELEHRAPHVQQTALPVVAGCLALAGQLGRVGCGQALAVKLAVGRQGQGIDEHPLRRDHVIRQIHCQRLAQNVTRWRNTLPHHVSNQEGAMGTVEHQHGGFAHLLVR